MLLVLVLEKYNLRPKDIYGGSGLGCSEVLVCVRACVRVLGRSHSGMTLTPTQRVCFTRL